MPRDIKTSIVDYSNRYVFAQIDEEGCYFDISDLNLLKCMLADKLLSANDIITNQILEGLLPWFLSRLSFGDANSLDQTSACMVLRELVSLISSNSNVSVRAQMVTTSTSMLQRIFTLCLPSIVNCVNRGCRGITNMIDVENTFITPSQRYFLGLVYSLLSSNSESIFCNGLQKMLTESLDLRSSGREVYYLNGVFEGVDAVLQTVKLEKYCNPQHIANLNIIIDCITSDDFTFISSLSLHAGNELRNVVLSLSDSADKLAIHCIDELDAHCILLCNCYLMVALRYKDSQLVCRSVICLISFTIEKCHDELINNTASYTRAKVKLVCCRIIHVVGKYIAKFTKYNLDLSGSKLRDLTNVFVDYLSDIMLVDNIQTEEYSELRNALNEIDDDIPCLELEMKLYLCDHFSRCSKVFMVDRWSSIMYAIQLIGLCDGGKCFELNIPDYPMEMSSQSNSSCQLVEFFSNQIDGCIPQTLYTILKCCIVFCKSICNNIIRDKHNCVPKIKFVAALETFVMSAWNCCISDGFQLNISAIGAFIEFLCDDSILQVLDFESVVKVRLHFMKNRFFMIYISRCTWIKLLTSEPVYARMLCSAWYGIC